MSNLKTQIFIINSLDRGANGERTDNISQFLKAHGFSTTIIDTQPLFDKTVNNLKKIRFYPFHFLLYRFLRLLVCKFNRKQFQPYFFYVSQVLRGQIIKKYLNDQRAKLVISQGSTDLFCAFYPRNYKIILDLPLIYSEEIRLEHQLSPDIISRISRLESKAYQQADRTCFHWHSFLTLAKMLHKPTNNCFILNWGCSPKSKACQYSKNPRIIFLGGLNSPWVNPKLLNNINCSSPIPINVFGYESPSSNLYSSLKYKGFLTDLDEINKYQFGLITISDDPVRTYGFSAKHLMYLNYGLPVLSPEWRRDKLLEPATIYYNQKNFTKQVNKYLDKKLWTKKHLAALKLAKKLKWSETLKPLVTEINKLLAPP